MGILARSRRQFGTHVQEAARTVKRMQRRFRTALAAAVVLLSACSVAPRVPQPKMAMPSRFAEGPVDALGPSPDLARWWRSFGDPQLDQLVRRALNQNLSLRAAGERLAAARELLGTPQARHLPQESLYTNQEPTPGSTASYFQIGFDAVWELGLFGRGESEQRIVDADAALADGDRAAAQVALAAEVARAYIDWCDAARRATDSAALLQQATLDAHLQRVRVEHHLEPAAVATSAQADVAAARAALVAARSGMVIAHQQLAVLLSIPAAKLDLRAPAAMPRSPRVPPVLPPAELLRTRPDIQRAEAAILRAAGELGIAKSDIYPRLGLGWTATASARTAGGEIGRLRTIPSFGPVINMPIFDWGLREAKIRADSHQLKAAVLDYRQTVLSAVAEVEQDYAALRTARARDDAATEALLAAKQAARAVAVRNRLGLDDQLAAGHAGNAALQAAIAAARARAVEDIAFVALYKALGGASPLAVAAPCVNPADVAPR